MRLLPAVGVGSAIAIHPARARRRTAPLAAVLSLFLVGANAGCAKREDPAPPKGIVLIVVDTLRPDFLGSYGARADASPYADRVAAEGVRFDYTVAAAGWTVPSISSLLTSRYPSELGEGSQADAAVSPAPPTVTELLRGAGYRTAAFVESDWNILRRGFESVEMAAGDLPARVAVPERNNAALTFSRAIDWLRTNADRPFFVLVHTCEVHDYFFGKSYQRAFADRRDPDYRGPFRSWGVRDGEHVGNWIIDTLLAADRSDLGYVRELYAATVEAVDREIARLDAVLGELGVRDDTVLVLTSDHGEGLRPDQHRVHHGGRLHQDLLRVPLVMRWPGRIPQAAVEQQRVELLDLMPTLLQLARVPLPGGVRGHSLLAPARGFAFWNAARLRVDVVPQPALAEESTFFVDDSGHRDLSSVRQAALQSGDLKLIRSGDRRELYDLARDPDETDDLAGERAGDLARLEAELVRLLPQIGGAGAPPRPEVIERLRALGYAK